MKTKTTRKQPVIIAVMADGYHITYRRGDGYCALVDSPYFSAVCLGWFDTQTEAQVAIDTYRYEEARNAA